jgi:predicted RNase H-like HicB family nuclease
VHGSDGCGRTICTVSSRTLSLTVVVNREDDRYVAQCLEVDVSSFGDTQDEAIAMITEALELWFEETPVPEHLNRPVVTTVDLQIPA